MVICPRIEQIIDLLLRTASFFLALFYGYIVLWITLFSVLKHGRSYFTVKKRTAPACLNSKDLGNHHYVEINKIKLHYVANGDSSKPMMLFLHGFPDFWFAWRHQLQRFSDNFYTVALDLRGFGDSDKPENSASYSMSVVAEDIKHFLYYMKRKKVILIGHDLGGTIAYKFASYWPELVTKLIIINAPHPEHFPHILLRHWPQFFKSWYIFFFQLPLLPEILLLSQDLNFFDKYYATSNPVCTNEEIEAYKYTYSQPGAFYYALKYYDLNNWKFTEKIKRIEVDTLIIWAKDEILDTICASAMSEFVDKFNFKVINYESHYPHVSIPITVNALINDFVFNISENQEETEEEKSNYEDENADDES